MHFRINLSIVVCLCLYGMTQINVAQARPSYATNNGNNCSACHSSMISGRMEILETDISTDLVTQLDGQMRGLLKTFRVVPGQTISLPIRILNGTDRFAIQIKGFENAGQRNAILHNLIWNQANTDDNLWTRQQTSKPPYFTKDNGANGGLTGSTEPSTYFFDFIIDPNTPLDMYELVVAVPGVKNGTKVYQEERIYLEVLSPFDLDFDSKIDCSDICVLIGQWHKDAPQYDFTPIGGDGIVDAQDLVTLSDHLFEDHRLIAHWSLDETSGPTTFDTVNNRLSVVFGTPSWQPDHGQIEGALSLTGEDNYLHLPFISNLAIRPFSVFMWIKGGEPGQVIVSQTNTQNWLMANPESGTLMTELTGTGRSQTPLISDVVIVDDAWHHVGLTWNGTQRALYVDQVEVARDDIPQPVITSQDLNVGTGIGRLPSSFWNGLVDDIRIYDRAIEFDNQCTCDD